MAQTIGDEMTLDPKLKDLEYQTYQEILAIKNETIMMLKERIELQIQTIETQEKTIQLQKMEINRLMGKGTG